MFGARVTKACEAFCCGRSGEGVMCEVRGRIALLLREFWGFVASGSRWLSSGFFRCVCGLVGEFPGGGECGDSASLRARVVSGMRASDLMP